MPDYEPESVRRALNYHLRDQQAHDVRFVKVWPDHSPNGVHARFSAKQRVYKYLIRAGGAGEPSVFDFNRVWHLPKPLDVVAMQRAADLLEGHHDFTSFRAPSCQAASAVRTLDQLQVTEIASPTELCEPGVQRVMVEVKSRAFLYHQVRNLVGFLRHVGDGTMEPSEASRILEAKDREAAPRMAPPYGLYLEEVKY